MNNSVIKNKYTYEKYKMTPEKFKIIVNTINVDKNLKQFKNK